MHNCLKACNAELYNETLEKFSAILTSTENLISDADKKLVAKAWRCVSRSNKDLKHSFRNEKRFRTYRNDQERERNYDSETNYRNNFPSAQQTNQKTHREEDRDNVTAEGRDHRNRITRDTQKSYDKQQHDEHYRTDRYRAKDSDSHRDHSSNYRPHRPNVWYNTRSRYESNYDSDYDHEYDSRNYRHRNRNYRHRSNYDSDYDRGYPPLRRDYQQRDQRHLN